jgi:hypothetical protein
LSTSNLDTFAQSIWPSPNDPPILQNCTVLVATGSMVAGPSDSLPPLSEVADLAAGNDAPHAAVRFHPGGDRRRVRAYAWAVDGSDAATYELDGDGQPFRTADAPPPLPAPKPPIHQDTTLEGFVAMILRGSPEVLNLNPPNVCYLTVNRHNIVYGAKIDFAKGDPPYVARISIEQEGGAPVGVCRVEDTQSGRAYRYTRPMKKRLMRSPVPVGPWSQPAEAPLILDELRVTMAR